MVSPQALIPFGNAQRVKGLLRTNLGPRGYNYSGDAVSVSSMAEVSDSRIEVISDVFFPALDFEKKLLEAAVREWLRLSEPYAFLEQT